MRVGVGVGLDVRAYVHACVVATMMCCDVEYRSSALRISQGPIEVATYVCRYRRMYVRRECERRAWMPASPELSLFRRTDQISGRHGRGREGGGGALGRNCRTKRAADDHSLAQMAYIVGSGGYMCLHACTSFVCLALCRLRVEGRSVSQWRTGNGSVPFKPLGPPQAPVVSEEALGPLHAKTNAICCTYYHLSPVSLE